MRQTPQSARVSGDRVVNRLVSEYVPYRLPMKSFRSRESAFHRVDSSIAH
jgi:hypothetical protein